MTDGIDIPQAPPWLARMPGYVGYHDKEQRRLADRALRDGLAERLADSVRGLQRLSATLATARRFDQLASVDTLTNRLQHLIDRVRTSAEGYRGLFERDRIDAAVLNQVYAFDAALAATVDRIGTLVGGLRSDGSDGVLSGASGQELVDLTDRLHARLDARRRLLDGDQPLEAGEALAVLADTAPKATPLLTLQPGDAVSYGGTDYIVDAAIHYSGDRVWTDYRLRDSDIERWLMVEPEAVSLVAQIRAEEVTRDDDGVTTVDDQQFRAGASGQATAAVIGPSGSQRRVSVSFHRYEAERGAVLVVRDWGAEQRHYLGTTIDTDLLTVYPRA